MEHRPLLGPASGCTNTGHVVTGQILTYWTFLTTFAHPMSPVLHPRIVSQLATNLLANSLVSRLTGFFWRNVCQGVSTTAPAAAAGCAEVRWLLIYSRFPMIDCSSLSTAASLLRFRHPK